jgi:hypothetical protein
VGRAKVPSILMAAAMPAAGNQLKELQHCLCHPAPSARICKPTVTLFKAIRVNRRRRLAMKTFIIALMLFFALASGISMMVLAFRADFRELAADNGGDRTTLPRPNSE